MKRRKYAREPLLYIHQPTVSNPTAPMQHSYTSTKKTSKKSNSSAPIDAETAPQKTIKKRPSLSSFTTGVTNTNELKEPQVKKRRPSFPVQEQEETESSSSSMEDLSEENSLERKKFIDMTIMEKIDYFINTPSHLPRLRCEVITSERKYRGIMLNKEEDVITMRVGRRSNKISLEDITEIRLLGF